MEEYHQMTLTEWADMKEQFRRELNNVRIAYIRVGYVLRRMDETKAYEAGGYKSVAEFAEKEHGLRPSTTSRWMSINREYSLDGYSMQLDPRYLGMNASQLTEMLGLPMEDRELVTPDTPREDIRELKRLQKMPECPEGFETIVRHFFDANPDVLDHMIDAMDKGAEEKDLIEIVSPSGNKAYRKDGAMIFLMEKIVKFKRAGHSPEEVQYAELFAIAKTVAEEKEEEEAENAEPAAVAETEEAEGQEEEREEEPEREQEEAEEAPAAAVEGDAEESAEGAAEEREETDESPTGDGQENVGGIEDEECGEEETVEEVADGENEEVCAGQQEAAPDEGSEEEFDGSMNPTVDNSAIAPAQKSDLSSKTLNEKSSTHIVDETGRPAPEEEEDGRRKIDEKGYSTQFDANEYSAPGEMDVKEFWGLIERAETMCDSIKEEISRWADWDTAMDKCAQLIEMLKRLKAEDDATDGIKQREKEEQERKRRKNADSDV